ncbi:MAG: type II secretion system protein M [Candidatus Omnitrophica bacterium]|nr:type II secretion system protein M [Candidatus Omnitrophota bacterium]
MKKLKFSIPKIKWGRREKILGTACAAMISLVFMDRLAITPWLQRMEYLRENLDSLEQTLLTEQRLLAREKMVRDHLERFKKYLVPVSDPGLQMATFLKEIQKLADEHQIASLEIKPQEGEVNDLFQIYIFDLQGEGDFRQWIRFVHAIESSPSLFQVERARVGVKEKQEGVLDITLRLTAISFR